MKRCPRCHFMAMEDVEALNSLSRRDNKTYICNTCGDEEALIDAGLMQPARLERKFVAYISKQTK